MNKQRKIQRDTKPPICGVRAPRTLIDLAVALEFGQPIPQAGGLPATEKLPAEFFEQTFARLKAAECVESRRKKFERQPKKYTPETVHQAVVSSAEDGYYETLYPSSANSRRKDL